MHKSMVLNLGDTSNKVQLPEGQNSCDIHFISQLMKMPVSARLGFLPSLDGHGIAFLLNGALGLP
jgi:hypothetical protein